MSKCSPHLDKILGLDQSISRRDFLEGALVASAGLAVTSSPLELLAQADAPGGEAWAGYTGGRLQTLRGQ